MQNGGKNQYGVTEIKTTVKLIFMNKFQHVTTFLKSKGLLVKLFFVGVLFQKAAILYYFTSKWLLSKYFCSKNRIFERIPMSVRMPVSMHSHQWRI
jgi:hypothetical protein